MSRQDDDNNNSKIHEERQDFVCGECGMTFADSDTLTVHYRNSHYMDWHSTRKAV
jgi:transposase-like protein